jgi:hypothetical protein
VKHTNRINKEVNAAVVCFTLLNRLGGGRDTEAISKMPHIADCSLTRVYLRKRQSEDNGGLTFAAVAFFSTFQPGEGQKSK